MNRVRGLGMVLRLVLGLGLVVAAAYQLLVLRLLVISYVLNGDSGRYADALISYIPRRGY